MSQSRRRRRLARGAVVVTAASHALFPPPAQAQTPTTWINPVSGTWTDASKWSGNSVPNDGSPPGTTYHARVAAAGPAYIVDAPGSAPIAVTYLGVNHASATVAQSSGTMTLGTLGLGDDGGAGTYRFGGGHLLVERLAHVGGRTPLSSSASAGVGTLVQTGGNLIAADQFHVGWAGGTGSVVVEGSSSSFSGSSAFYGMGGTAHARFGGGASVNFSRIEVGGALGAADLLVDGGARVRANWLVVGHSDSFAGAGGERHGEGTVAVSGPGTQLTVSGSGRLLVGSADAGSGHLQLNGGTITLQPASFPFEQAGIAARGTLAVAGGHFDARRDFNVAGRLLVSGGSAAFASRLSVNANGHARVSGGSLTVATLLVNSGSFEQQASHVSIESCVLGNNGSFVATAGAQAVVRMNWLHFAAPTVLDLNDNRAIIDYAVAAPPFLVDYIRNAYDDGSWTGSGITSTSARLNANHALGYAESTAIFNAFPAVFAGEVVDATAFLIRYTRNGDADLDGTVNLGDFNRLAANFGSTSALWDDGDFNYDGAVNLLDFNLLAANFGQSAAGDAVTPGDWANLAAAVPEPATGSAILAMAATLMTRRRRNLG